MSTEHGDKNNTWEVADVGKTRICVQVTSWGVDNWQLTDVWLNRSSGVNWSGMSLSAESGSRETRHALRMQGTSVGDSRLHWLQISRRCLDAFKRALRLNSQLQPKFEWKLVRFRYTYKCSFMYKHSRLTFQFSVTDPTDSPDHQSPGLNALRNYTQYKVHQFLESYPPGGGLLSAASVWNFYVYSLRFEYWTRVIGGDRQQHSLIFRKAVAYVENGTVLWIGLPKRLVGFDSFLVRCQNVGGAVQSVRGAILFLSSKKIQSLLTVHKNNTLCSILQRILTSLFFRKKSARAADPNPVSDLTFDVWTKSLRHCENTERANDLIWSFRRIVSLALPNSTMLSREIIWTLILERMFSGTEERTAVKHRKRARRERRWRSTLSDPRVNGSTK